MIPMTTCPAEPRLSRLIVCLAFSSFIAIDCDTAAWGQGNKADYERSRTYSARTRNRVFRESVKPTWFDDDRKLWYRIQTGIDSHEYILVDVERGERAAAFDHQQLGQSLAKALGRPINARNLNLSGLVFSSDATSCRFQYAGRSWHLALSDGTLVAETKTGKTRIRTGLPAKAQWVRSREGGDRTPISFENRLGKTLDVFWVRSDGRLQQYGSVAAGETKTIATFAGHAWLLKDRSKKNLAAFVADVKDEKAIIDEKTASPNSGGKPRSRPNRRGDPNRSPDQKWSVLERDSNLWLRDLTTGDERRLTTDGSADDAYQGRIWWAPNSMHFAAMRLKPGLRRSIHIIESAPRDSIHSRLLTLPYAKPGDRIDQQRPVLFSFDQDWKPRIIENDDFDNPYSTRDLAWKPDSRSFSFLYNERGHQRLSLITVDAESAKPKLTIDEKSDTFICYSSKSYLRRLDATREIIWMSERSGWNHLYLINDHDGSVKRPLTSGEWVVRKVERFDEAARQIELEVSGLDSGQDPYYSHLIRVDLDTGNSVRLTDGDGDHSWEYSPSRKYLLDRYSRVDMPTVTVLRDAATGAQICLLERADMTQLKAAGWQPPERFVAKGRDGKTDIHGIIVRPTHFDPKQKYPVLEHIYAGPHSSFVPKSFGLHTGLYAMAELGFIVVKIDGMGTSNRSKAFHDVCWKNLGDSGFPDRIAWMKAAAQQRIEMDLQKVGIWGGSAGGQSAMRALLAHGDFYHAAVADCGCHDNRVDKIWWNEQWMGWPIGPHYKEQSNVTQAHRLQGDLMLIWGELDRNVDPASTMQVVDALVRANKDFVQLIVPGAGHGAAGHPYARQRQSDFFVRKLWEREPRAD